MLFSALVLLYTVKLYQWRSGECKRTKCFWLVFTAISVLMLLFRNNAVYAYLAAQPFIYDLWKKSAGSIQPEAEEIIRERKYYTVTMLAALILFGAANTGLKAVTLAESGSPREILSVPLQQMARTRVLHEEEIDSSMRE